MNQTNPKAPKAPLPHMRFVLSFLCLLLSSCGTIEQGVPQVDGSVQMVPVARVKTFGTDVDFEKDNSMVIAAPHICITRPDGYSISATNATVTIMDRVHIGKTANGPSYLNAGANMINAGAKLVGATPGM